MAYVLKEDGTTEKLADTNLKTLQYWVGGWIEHIRLDDGRDAFVNEDGLRLGLRFNAEASLLAGRKIVGYMVVAEKGEVD